MKRRHIILGLLGSLGMLGTGLLVWLRKRTLQPADIQSEPVTCRQSAPILQPGQSLKVMSYNVQFMAGKNYWFFYDGGPDTRPSSEDMMITLAAVARLIRAENPDVILLQEVNDGAKMTDYEDQLARLLALLPREYACYTSAFYWQADFVPHPKLMGAVGIKLAIISKYQISSALRHQLPLRPGNWLFQQFYFKRAVLEARLPVANGESLVILNTHLDAFTGGTDISCHQIAAIQKLLDQLNRAGRPWLLGGDFNLLPPGQYVHLPAQARDYFQPQTEIKPLYDRYQSVIPDMTDFSRPAQKPWLTFFPNKPDYSEPIITLDHLFLADQLQLTTGYVRRHDALTVSDHLPLIAEFVVQC